MIAQTKQNAKKKQMVFFAFVFTYELSIIMNYGEFNISLFLIF